MKYFILLFITLIMSKSFFGQLTQFEKTNGTETATYFQCIEWYKKLDKKYTIMSVKEMGMTDAGIPLHLVMITAEGGFDPKKWHEQKKVVLLINNGIHPGEPDGIDASMMLVRDICKKKIVLPVNVVLAFIPVYNIGGALNRNATTRVNQNGPLEYGFRGNSQNLDLNRDFTKNDSKESKSFAAIFHFLDPDIFLDNHVSDGADYQHTMTLITTQYEKLGPLGKYLKNDLEPKVYAGMQKKGWDMIPYLNFETLDVNKGTVMFSETPRYSTGYAALFNTMGFMAETHMLKPYKERVRSTYDLMLTIIEEAKSNAPKIINQRIAAKKFAGLQTIFPLNWRADTTSSTSIIFKGYEQNFTTSDATGLQKMYYNKLKPFTTQLQYFNTYKAGEVVQIPKAYIIPQGWYEVIERLKTNCVVIEVLKKDTVIKVGQYRIENYKSFITPFEKHHKNYGVKVAASLGEIKFLRGDYIIRMNQPSNRYIVEMLEPMGDDSFFAWNFFDAILQQKEGYSNYRWEELAAIVLQKDPLLKEKLEQKKKNDPKFALNSNEILDFIYKNSEYYEKVHLQYPVYRLEN